MKMVGDTRVLLELVIRAYLHLGETPEGIVDSYPSLNISEVYAVLAYYLANPDEIDAYIRNSKPKQVRLCAHACINSKNRKRHDPFAG